MPRSTFSAPTPAPARSLAALALLLLLVAIGGSPIGCATGGGDDAAPRATRVEDAPWVDLRAAAGYNWSGVAARLPVEVGRIDRVLRNRAVYRLPGFGFGHLMLGPGALYPDHAHASPEAYHVVGGEAEWSVDGETRRVGPGTTIYHAPYARHRWVTTSPEPLRVVWAQWAPDGDRRGLIADAVARRGGASTGPFLAGETRSRRVLPTRLVAPVAKPEAGSVIESMRRAYEATRAKEAARPPIRTFVDSVGIPWNTSLPGLRWRLVFATPDLEWGHVIVSAGGERTIPPSEAPWLLHVLSGRARLRAGRGDGVAARVGTTFAVRPGEAVEIEVDDESDGPLRGFWVRRAPAGDLDYWARDYFLVEPMPRPPADAELARDVSFFPLAWP